jgi:hypothetical protein
MAGFCLHILDRDRSGGAIRDLGRNEKTAWRSTRSPRCTRPVLRKINHDRTEIAVGPSQRAAREALLRAGAQWIVCRSAISAMWGLYKSGVPFRTLVHEDGTIERWQQPKLWAWEVPKRDPHERRPRAPEWEPAAEIAEPAAARDDAAGSISSGSWWAPAPRPLATGPRLCSCHSAAPKN